jgi:hypothetical protein
MCAFTECIRLDATPKEIARQGAASVFNRAAGYTSRGQAYAGQKHYDKAIADYEEARRIYVYLTGQGEHDFSILRVISGKDK